MDIKIEERFIGAVTVLDMVGKLTIDAAALQLKDKINSLISQQRTRIVVNLGRCRISTAVASASWWPRTGRSGSMVAPSSC
jgi:hypothetical protein